LVSSVFVDVHQAAFLFIRQRIQQILRRLEVLVEDGGDAVAVHAGLFDVKVRRFMRREEDVVVCGVLVALELRGRDVAAEMVVASGS
jgi:hypothetical protein